MAAWSSGTAPAFTFFWQETDHADAIGRGCLSQWWSCRFEVDGTEYRSAEHWMMAAKARLFDDHHALKAVPAARHPADAKQAGRSIRGYDEHTWRQRRYDIVVTGNLAKFGQAPELARYLLGTEPTILVEASPRDLVWGIGLAADDPRAANPTLWRGQNLLGFALMDVRQRLAS